MIHGRYFDARTSTPLAATLQSEEGGWRLRAGDVDRLLDPRACRVSDRIGSIPRRVHLVDGTEFETDDNDGMDAIAAGDLPPHSRLIHALERNWGVAVAALAGVAVTSFLIIRFGLPAASGFAAERLPAGADRVIGAHTMEVLDRTFLDDSLLTAARQAQLASLFDSMTAPLDDGHEYQLLFRNAPKMGANAFALPSGIIVITDQLVRLAQDDRELMAVLAHEIGHVRGRHMLRKLIQSAGVSTLALVVLGDAGSVSAIVTAAPALIQAKHSRDFEREADGFARRWMRDAGIPESHFDQIMCRMGEAHFGKSGEPPAFLSSHPGFSERADCG